MTNLMKTAVLLSFLFTLTAQASPTAVGVARTAKDAVNNDFDGEILIDSSTLILNLEGVHTEYKLMNGMCFGAVTSQGCFYASPEPGQPDISITSRCVSKQAALTTYKIGVLTLYSYMLTPNCQLMPDSSRSKN